jgi:formate-nitrite transporter family protein
MHTTRYQVLKRKPIAKMTLPVEGRDHIQGPLTATIQLTIYGDYACAGCAAIHGIIRELRARLTSNICYAFRHFPARGQARPHHAAEMAEAAAAQGRFWEMHDLLLQSRGALSDDDLARYARLLGLNTALAMREVFNGVHASRIQQDFLAAKTMNVTASPAFFVNGQRCDGLIGLSALMEEAVRCRTIAPALSSEGIL